MDAPYRRVVSAVEEISECPFPTATVGKQSFYDVERSIVAGKAKEPIEESVENLCALDN